MDKHYSKIKPGDRFKVVNMVPHAGRDAEGEPRPPVVANGTIVQAVKVGVDSVTVKTPQGKEVTFSHSIGLTRLEPVAAEAGDQQTEGGGRQTEGGGEA